MTTLLTVLGTRPEIIKLSPLLPLLDARWQHIVVHTGQHYDHALDGVFFDELRLRSPDHRLAVGSGEQSLQTARMLMGLEPIMQATKPDAVLVQGDTNSTLAGALTACKLGIPVIHLEAGCRSFNRHMPEELNRVIVDHCSDLLLAANADGQRHLQAEGIARQNIHVAGSTAIDACLRNVRLANSSSILQRHQLRSRDYLLCTLHRAENTHPAVLPGLIAALNTLAELHHVVVPLHPRTRAAMHTQGLQFTPSVHAIDPVSYLDMLQVLRHARAVLTDSGGLQEEAAALNIPLLVLREETEWTYLVDMGKAVLIGNQPDTVLRRAMGSLTEASLNRMRATGGSVQAGAAQAIIQIIATWLDARTTYDAQPFSAEPESIAVAA